MQKQGDGATLLTHLRRGAAQSMVEARLKLERAPDLPHSWEYLWRWFNELAGSRQQGMGLSPLSWAECDSWARRTKREPERYEWDLIRKMDGMLIDALTPAPKATGPQIQIARR